MNSDHKDLTEPDAAKRRMARELWEMFIALNKAGFTEEQSLKIIGNILAGSSS